MLPGGGHQSHRLTVGFSQGSSLTLSDAAAVASIDLSQDAGVGCQLLITLLSNHSSNTGAQGILTARARASVCMCVCVCWVLSACKLKKRKKKHPEIKKKN